MQKKSINASKQIIRAYINNQLIILTSMKIVSQISGVEIYNFDIINLLLQAQNQSMLRVFTHYVKRLFSPYTLESYKEIKFILENLGLCLSKEHLDAFFQYCFILFKETMYNQFQQELKSPSLEKIQLLNEGKACLSDLSKYAKDYFYIRLVTININFSELDLDALPKHLHLIEDKNKQYSYFSYSDNQWTLYRVES